MTPAQLQKVRETWAVLRTRDDQFAQRFYQQLFQLDPSLRLLFAHDMSAQRRKLMRTIGILVRGLNRPERIRPALCLLGQRHARYGVQETDYTMVRQALLGAMAELLDGAFSQEVREAWAAAYEEISLVMLSAAQENEPIRGL